MLSDIYVDLGLAVTSLIYSNWLFILKLINTQLPIQKKESHFLIR